MADKAVTFGAKSALFGAVAGWEYRANSANEQFDRATAHDDENNETTSTLFNERTDHSATLECQSDTNTVPDEIGEVVNSVALTGIAITTQASAYAEMTLTGHNHADNAHSSLNSVAHGIALAACYGATDFLGGTAGDNATPIRGTITISCDHTDENDAVGAHFAGENHNPRIEAETEWLGVPSVAAEAGWDVTVTTTNDERSGLIKTVVRGTKALAFA